jgi:hypothetical protein
MKLKFLPQYVIRQSFWHSLVVLLLRFDGCSVNGHIRQWQTDNNDSTVTTVPNKVKIVIFKIITKVLKMSPYGFLGHRMWLCDDDLKSLDIKIKSWKCWKQNIKKCHPPLKKKIMKNLIQNMSYGPLKILQCCWIFHSFDITKTSVRFLFQYIDLSIFGKLWHRAIR